jgi:hypothetical protein
MASDPWTGGLERTRPSMGQSSRPKRCPANQRPRFLPTFLALSFSCSHFLTGAGASLLGRGSSQAGVAQLVEHQLAMLDVAGSNPVSRSIYRRRPSGRRRVNWGPIESQSGSSHAATRPSTNRRPFHSDSTPSTDRIKIQTRIILAKGWVQASAPLRPSLRSRRQRKTN